MVVLFALRILDLKGFLLSKIEEENDMTISIDQYTIETTWSTRITDDIVLNSIEGDIPPDMERSIINN